MRSAALLLVGVAVCSAHAQNAWLPAFGKIVDQAVKTKNSLPASNPKIGEQFKLIHADKAHIVGDLVEASGNVHATYKGYEIFADKLTGSRRTQVFQLEGDSKLIGATETVTGGIVLVDFRNDQFSFEKGTARIKPERLQGKVTGDVFVKAARGAGLSNDFTTEYGKFTTCDLLNPHYELDYDTNRIIPGKRAELRGVRLEILGHTVLKLPMLVIPLSRQAPKYLPEFGNSVDEGYYVKTRITTPLPGENFIDTRVDLMSKLGAGLGFDYNYENSALSGKLSVYSVTGGSRSRVYSATHQQKVGRGTLNLTSSYQISDYLTAPGSTLWNTNAMFQLPWGGGTSRLGFNRYSSESSGFKSSQQTISFGDDRSTRGFQSRLDLNLSKSDASGIGFDPNTNQRLDVRYNATTSFRSFTADLLYQRSVPVGKSTNFFSSSDITPMLSLRSTGDKLFGQSFGSVWPMNMEASIGELLNPSAAGDVRVTRMDFEFDVRRSTKMGQRLSLNAGSRFQQGLYSDDTAQYVLAYDGNLNYQFARDSSVSVSYNNLRAFGFTPLAIDSTGRNDNFSFDLNYKPSRTLSLSAQSGYDVFQGSQGQVPWQYVWLRAKYKPGNWLDLNTTASYDTFSQAWSNLRLDAGMKLGETSLSLGARYDGLRSQLAGFNLLVDGFRVGKVTTNFLLDYNGYTQQLDSQHYQFIYNLHCAEAVLEVIDNQVGFRSGRTVSFFIRLKAFPFGSNFGLGTRGQSIGGGSAYGFGD
ncbi:MAG: hypothetical protein JSS66_04425 [Armatimonadetes bacterium]|nr:hypothetical protein [Armatimonadota bacterium]